MAESQTLGFRGSGSLVTLWGLGFGNKGLGLRGVEVVGFCRFGFGV